MDKKIESKELTAIAEKEIGFFKNYPIMAAQAIAKAKTIEETKAIRDELEQIGRVEA